MQACSMTLSLREPRYDPGVNFINVLRVRFSYKIFIAKNFKSKSQLRSFWRQNFVQKTHAKTLMKLTTGCFCVILSQLYFFLSELLCQIFLSTFAKRKNEKLENHLNFTRTIYKPS